MKEKIEFLEKELATLKAELLKTEKPEKWQDKLVQPSKEKYFYINASHESGLYVYEDDTHSVRKPEHAFKTLEQAELVKEKMLLMQEMLAFAHVRNEGWTAHWEEDDQEKWGIIHDEIVSTKFEVIQGWLSNSFIFGITVKSREIAKEMFFIFGERVKKYYNILY